MFDFSPDSGLWLLAASAFLAATVLPDNLAIVLISVPGKFPALFWQCIVIAAVDWRRSNLWWTLLMLANGKCARYLAIGTGWMWFEANWVAWRVSAKLGRSLTFIRDRTRRFNS